MATQRPGIVVVTKFCKSTSNTFSNYINYINRNEATRNENSGKYSLYQDYMDNSEKTTGLFTANSFDLSESEKKQLKEVYQAAQENGSLMWQTVISFDNDWLKKNNMYVNDVLDEERLKSISKTAINKMLEKENLSNAVWSAAIHYNTDNIHIHIATVEPEPMREQKEYAMYQYKEVNGKKVKQPVIDAAGNPITRKEFKGKFKQSSLEVCKSEIVNQIINQRENNLKINSIIRDSIVAQKKEHVLSKDKDLCKMFSDLYQNMPEVGRNLWNYNNPVMYSLRDDIDALSTHYLEKYHSEEFNEFKKMILEQADKYREAYGGESDYADTKMKDLYTRLGNTILKEIREFDKNSKIRHETSNSNNIYKEPIEELNYENELDEILIEDVAAENFSINWTAKYKNARNLIFQKKPNYEQAFKLLKEEHANGNVLATYELGDMYKYGRGTKIDTNVSNQYYTLALKGFEKLLSQSNEKQADYINYRIGKMYYYGHGAEQNYDKALSYFRESKNNKYAKYMIANMTAYGQGIDKNIQQAFNDYVSLATTIPYASYKAGLMIEQDQIEGGSETQMNELYRIAFNAFIKEENKTPDANLEYRIGCMYLYGRGVLTDINKATEYFEQSSSNGNIFAKEKLSGIYIMQNNTEKLPAIIENLQEVANKTKSNWAMYNLGNIYSDKSSSFYDIEKAVEWYQNSSKQGNNFANFKLGKLYYTKDSEIYDINKASEYFKKCNDSFSLYCLGKIYCDKENQLFDATKGINYLRQSSEANNSYASLELGLIYLRGDIVEKNINMAKEWLQISAEQGNSIAHNILLEQDIKTKQPKNNKPINQHRPKASPNLTALGTCIKNLKKGLKSEFEKSRLDREHDQLIEQSISD